MSLKTLTKRVVVSGRGQHRKRVVHVVVQMLASTGRIATPFYILYVAASVHMTGKLLGLLSLAFIGADALSNLVWGYLGDKTGFRLVLLDRLFGALADGLVVATAEEDGKLF